MNSTSHAGRRRRSILGLASLPALLAAYAPGTFGPLPGGEGWSGESNQGRARYGESLASAGDVNGDGYADAIVGAPGFSNGESAEGRAFVYHGSPTGLDLQAAWVMESDFAGAIFGSSVASAGDVNGDGYADVIVGAPLYDSAPFEGGRAFVYLGSATGLELSEAWVAGTSAAGDLFGITVASAGDVNGDGFDDVLVGAPGVDSVEPNVGRVFAYLGSATGLALSPSWTATTGKGLAQLGHGASSAGDVNGDGYDDVIVGAPGFNALCSVMGRAWIYLGSPTGLETDSAWSVDGRQCQARLGQSVSSAGDVNGDGLADVAVVSAVLAEVSVFFGSTTQMSTVPDWSFRLATSMTSVGDVNGDGYSDLLAGEESPSVPNGEVYLFLGGASGPSATPDWTFSPGQPRASFGRAVASAGDVNADGYDDSLVGAPYFDSGQQDEGKAFLFPGSATGPQDLTLSSVAWRNFGTNPDSYVAAPPSLGRDWTATVDLTTTGHDTAKVYGYAQKARSAPLPSGNVYLVTGARRFQLPARSGPEATWTVPIPADPALCGIAVYTQAVHLFGVEPYALTNAQDLVVGF